MRWVAERSLATPTVEQIVFLADDGFKFTAYIDAGDEGAVRELAVAFAEMLPPEIPEVVAADG